MKKNLILLAVKFAIVSILLLGEVKCIIKVFQCDWNPIGKAEILYTGSALTGLGCIVGYINIEDN